MSAFLEERVLSVHHWTDSLFSFKTTRKAGLRFENGQFTMIGLPQEDGKPILRAYSVVSPNYEEHLEFLSIKVPDGALTSKLQHIQPGDTILLNRRPTGTLRVVNLRPGKRLYLFATGTGLAPFMSVIRDPLTYERFERVILIHGVRTVDELAYRDYLTRELPEDELMGETVKAQLTYVPTVTREPFEREGRIQDLFESGRIHEEFNLPPLDPAVDRVMICGSPSMLRDLKRFCEERNFEEGNSGEPRDFLIERAFVES